MKMGRMSSRYDPYELGYTRVTRVITKINYFVKFNYNKCYFSSNYFLKSENMKLKSLVIENQNVSVKRDPNLVHTARHAKEIVFIRKVLNIYCFILNFFIKFSIKI